jgi:glycosyltransferase involved in cell wall biosynthesis
VANKTFKISIITINFNNKFGLIKTVQSVINQSFGNLEYIIIDGNSSDGSKEFIEQHKEQFSYWVSEPDQGIYDAMNKGIKIAQGEYCLFLNSGDYLLEKDTLNHVFKQDATEDILYGNLKSDTRDFLYPKHITLATFVNGTIPHQASFIKRELFNKFGMYDESYPVIADWVFFVKVIMLYDVSYKHLDMYISFFEDGGISTESALKNELQEQRSDLFMTLFPKIFPDYIEMQQELRVLKSELNSYKNSRVIQIIRGIQKRILKNR